MTVELYSSYKLTSVLTLTASDMVVLTSVVLGLLLYVIISHLNTVKECRGKYPPGPTLWPVFLNKILYLRYYKRWSRTLLDYRQIHGDLVTIFREQPVVYLHGVEAITEAFVTNAAYLSDRPPGSGTHYGVTFGYSPAWKHLRKHLVRFLRESNPQQADIEAKVHEELKYLFDELQKYVNKPHDLSPVIHGAVANITGISIFGQRYDYDAPECSKKIASKSEKLMILLRIADAIPILKVVPWMLPGYTEALSSRQITRDYAKRQYYNHVRSYDPSYIRDYIDSLLRQQKSNKNKPCSDSYSELHIRESIVSFLLAGADTSRAVICWAVLYAAVYPDIQELLHNEIDDILSNKLPTYKDYLNMPYTQAFLTECLRMRPVVAESLPHIATKDVTVKGQTIPKGTVVQANIYSVTHDEQLFGNDCNVFKPDRHLKEGKFVTPKKFIIFGIGHRKCPGELIARVTTPLFIIKLLQHYDIRLGPDQDIDMCGEQYAVYMTCPYKVVLTERF